MSFFKWLSNKLNPPRARIALGTQKNEYALGEEVKGDFQIVSEEEFEVERIAVNLSCWENLKKTRTVSTQVGDTQKHRTEQYWDQAKLYSDQFVVCNSARIPHRKNGKQRKDTDMRFFEILDETTAAKYLNKWDNLGLT